MSSSSSSPGLFLALGSAGLYGLNIVFAGAASLGGVPGSALVVYRVLLMLVLVAGAAMLMRHTLRVAPEERRTMIVLGLSTAVVGLCYLSSVAFIPVTVAAVVFYAYPSLIVLASPFVDGHVSHRARWRWFSLLSPVSSSSWVRSSPASTGAALPSR